MTTRTELLLYQLGLRLVQAKELHDPHDLEQAVAVVRLSVVRLRDAFAPLCTLPNLGPDMGSASGILVEWLNEPRHFDRLGIAELHDRERFAETCKQRFDVMQEEVRTATRRRWPESRLEKWFDLGLKMLSIVPAFFDAVHFPSIPSTGITAIWAKRSGKRPRRASRVT